MAVLLGGLLCLLGSGTAWGIRGHEFKGVFGTPGSGVGQMGEPVGVAVNEESGAIYVVDRAGGRILVFDGTPNNIDGILGTTVAQSEFDGSGSFGEELKAGAGGRQDEEPTGKFSEPEAVAVDNACRDHRPEPLAGLSCEKYDPSDGDVYVLDYGHEVVDKYSASGQYIGQISTKTLQMMNPYTNALRGIAVEADGDVVISTRAFDRPEEGVFRLSNEVQNQVLSRIGNKTGFTLTAGIGLVLPGLGTASGSLYVLQQQSGTLISTWTSTGEFVSERPVTAAGLAGEVCSGGLYIDEGREGEGAELSRLSEAGSLIEQLAIPGGGGGGVGVDCVGSGGTVFVAEPRDGNVAVFGPEGPKPPEVVPSSSTISDVTSSSAVLTAEVNPRSEPEEEATQYIFEYGSCPLIGSCADSPFEHDIEGRIPAAFDPTSVKTSVSGLVPDDRYHFRVGARNDLSLNGAFAYGQEVVFVMQSSSPVGLLDDRHWELVSPISKGGAEFRPISEMGIVEASASGDAMTFLASTATEAGASGNSNQSQIIARRGVSGWESCDIALPNGEATGVSTGEGQQYLAFSVDLERGLARPFGGVAPGLVPGEREVSPLLVDASGACADRPSSKALLVSCPESGECEPATEESADLPRGIKVAEEDECKVSNETFCDATPLGTSADLSAAVISSKTPLADGAPRGALYEWAGEQVFPVSVRQDGSVIGEARFPALGTNSLAGSSVRDAVSSNGARVAWSESDAGDHLYLWDRAEGLSAQLDVVQGGSGSGPVGPVYQYMSADGSRVFFTDTQALTLNSGARSDAPDLYECVMVEAEAGVKCELHDLTPSVGGVSGESADVQGEVLGGSSDGTTLYFVANGQMASNMSGEGEVAIKGDCKDIAKPVAQTACNLFRWDGATGEISFVGVLSGLDSADWGNSNGRQALIAAQASTDGSWLVFMSQRELTGQTTRDAVESSAHDEQVFEYHAGGALVCISCNPFGERPHGVPYDELDNGVAGGHNVWPASNHVWLASMVPAWTPFRLELSQYQSRYLASSGRVFFDSSDSLVAGAARGVMNVYEFEPVGVGSCESGDAGFVPLDDGCLGMVSSATSAEESGFLDASQTGDDVFFLTASKLSKADTDTAYDVYDAHVGGAVDVEPPASGTCSVAACQVIGPSPEPMIPGSLGFEGPGSPLLRAATAKPEAKPTRAQQLATALKRCRRYHQKRRRSVCERAARKRFAPAKKTNRRPRKT